jgi:ketosteroid isomerase-like protein
MSTSTAELIRRYYAVVGDLASSADELENLLADDVRVVEHPNAITPHGAVRGRAEVMAARESGRSLLSDQAFQVHEVVALDGRAVARVTWTGTIGATRGGLVAGTELRADVASFFTVTKGRIVEQETFDCYLPLPV